MTIGQRVKLVLKNLDVNQQDFGAVIGIRQNQMSLIVNDKGEFSHENIQQIILKFGINLNWLFAEVGTIYIENNDKNIVKEPNTIYKVPSQQDLTLQKKYIETLEKLSIATEKEVQYMHKIMDLEKQLVAKK